MSAASGTLLKSLTSAEHEFLAEEELIVIIPSEDHPLFRFISGTFGPFSSGMPCTVPMWLALTLRKKGKCTIKIPDWMTVTALAERSIKHERAERTLGPLPFYYMEIAQLLLNNAREDIESPDQVGALLQDLESIRMDRIRMGITSVSDEIQGGKAVVSANLQNVGSLEIFTIKRFFLNAMDAFFKLCPPEGESAAGSSGTAVGISSASAAEDASTGLDDGTATGGRRRLRRFHNG